MVFSSPSFVFGFLPVVLTAYYALPTAGRNLLLTLASLLFYAWGETTYAPVMLLSILFNHGCAVVLGGLPASPARTGALAGAVALNLAALGWFKYATFLTTTLNATVLRGAPDPLVLAPIHLPIGISFFTFHAVSYLVDVYRGAVTPQRSVLRTALYVSFFPQLIAGPIVRYKDIAAQLTARVTTQAAFLNGVGRFVGGLGKKVLIADMLAPKVDTLFALPAAALTPPLAWLAVLAYTLQIYFDFSGYSDMAIGLARMFGFTLRENFDYPYVARSVRDFWRRWHISLSTWFRDYLYVPLGGSRGSRLRTGVNLLIVFSLCGMWHGAAVPFLVWGLWHGVFLVLERTPVGGVLARLPSPLRHVYTMGVVVIGWVVFRAPTLDRALLQLAAMAGSGPATSPAHPLAGYLDGRFLVAAGAGLLLCAPAVPTVRRMCARAPGSLQDRAWHGAAGCVLAATFLLSTLAMAAGTYNPFIYFRF